MKRTLVVIAAVFLFAGRATSQVPGEPLVYPYVAAPERQAQILDGFEEIKPGMSPSDVTSFLGQPDEIRSLLDHIKNSEPVGYTWWFIIERKAESGSVVEKAEKLVRVTFNLTDEVTHIDSWGIE